MFRRLWLIPQQLYWGPRDEQVILFFILTCANYYFAGIILYDPHGSNKISVFAAAAIVTAVASVRHSLLKDNKTRS